MRSSLVLVIVLLFITNSSNAQGHQLNTEFFTDVNGALIPPKRGFDIEGSPMLFNFSHLVDITLQNGKVYKGLKADVNVESNRVLVKRDTTDVDVSTPIKKLEFFTNLSDQNSKRVFVGYNKDYAPINHKDSKVLEFLAGNEDSKFALFNSYLVTFTESQRYGTAITEKKYILNTTFYALNNSKKELVKVSKTKNSILNFFKNNNVDVKKYVEEKKLDLKKDEDISKLFDYVNSL